MFRLLFLTAALVLAACSSPSKTVSDAGPVEQQDLSEVSRDAISDASRDAIADSKQSVCGNGRLEGAEQCDKNRFFGKTCLTFGFFSGSLRCVDCRIKTDKCSHCGNGTVDEQEQCDGTDLRGKSCRDLGFDSGTLGCNACSYDTSKCIRERCGNQVLDNNEACDGKNLAGKTCDDFGFDGGTLGCKANCDFDTSACNRCGDGKVGGREQCDGGDLGAKASCAALGFDGGTLFCSTSCRYKTDGCHRCGDGTKQTGEDCDGVDFGATTCQSLGFSGGQLTCSPSCQLETASCARCGDGKANGKESCDGSDLGGATCQGLGFDDGTLTCRNCRIDLSGCNRCGDEKIGGKEACDGRDLGTATCQSAGFDGGTLACTSTCQLSTTACFRCGDGRKNGAEQCDQSDLAGQSCLTLGFDGGLLTCGRDCRLNKNDCHRCGDGAANGLEPCDGSDLGGHSCVSEGFGRGSLACKTDCTLDTSACDACGNSRIDPGEICDGPNTGSASCRRRGYHEGTLACNGTCSGYDESGCVTYPSWAVTRYEGPELAAVWISPGGRVWAVGKSGTIVYRDGDFWQYVPSPTSSDLATIAGRSDSDIWIAGDGGSLLRYDGKRWSLVDTPSVTASSLTHRKLYQLDGTVYLLSARGSGWSATSEIWRHTAAGGWNRVLDNVTGLLNGIWGADKQLWVVGDRTHYHFDGKVWSTFTLNTQKRMNGIWGSSANNIWAVGEDATIELYDGTAWSVYHNPPTYTDLVAIWGNRKDNVWVARKTDSFNRSTRLLHFDGAQWSNVANTETLSSVGLGADMHGRGDRVFAIFSEQPAHGDPVQSVPLYLDKTGVWQRGDPTLLPGSNRNTANINDLSASEREAWVSGSDATLLRCADSRCLRQSIPQAASTSNFKAVGATTQGGATHHLWLAASADRYPYTGNDIYHHDGTNWSTQTLAKADQWLRLRPTVAGSGDVRLAGNDTLWRNLGGTWVEETVGSGTGLVSFVCLTSDDCWGITSNGATFYTRTSAGWTEWKLLQGDPVLSLNDVSGVSTNNIYFVGGRKQNPSPEEVRMYRFDGSRIYQDHSLDSFNLNRLTAVSVRTDSDIWIAGLSYKTVNYYTTHYYPSVLHYDGKRWRIESAPANAPIARLVARGAVVWAITTTGNILRLKR
jgi:hypothetical protein